jgi:general secretion pathway protein G
MNKVNSQSAGFTLIELIIVVAIIGILAGIAVPAMQDAPTKAREAVIRADLYQMRSCIDQYLADKGVYPESLEALVDSGYLRFLPTDPFTGKTEGVWREISAEPTDIEDLEPIEEDLMPEGGFGIIDVKYADETRVALDGSLISEW